MPKSYVYVDDYAFPRMVQSVPPERAIVLHEKLGLRPDSHLKYVLFRDGSVGRLTQDEIESAFREEMPPVTQ